MSLIGSIGAGASAGVYAINRQAASAATQEVRRAEQAERQASELMRESRSARAEATRLRQVADQRENEAGTYQDQAREARRNSQGSTQALRLDAPLAMPASNRSGSSSESRTPYATVRPATGQVLDTSA